MFIFTWKIEHFNMCLINVGSYFDSPLFGIATMKNTKGYLRLYPGGRTHDTQITCYLCGENEKVTFPADSHIKLSFNSYSKAEEHKYVERYFKKDEEINVFVTERRDVLYGARSSFFPDGVLTIKCEIKENPSDVTLPVECFAKTTVLIKLYEMECPLQKSLFIGSDDWRSTIETEKIILFRKQTEVEEYDDKFKINFRFEYPLIETGRHVVEIRKLSEISDIQSMVEILILMQDDFGPLLITSGEFYFKEGGLNEVLDLHFYLNEDQIRSLQHKRSSLYCEFKISDGSVISSMESNNLMSKKEISNKLEKFPVQILGEIYRDKPFSDIVLQVETDQYAANKCILAAASPIFKTNLENDTEKNKANIMEIADVASDTVNKMIKFLYTGLVEASEFKTIENMFIAAEKYQILRLKQECSLLLLDRISVENAVHLLELAHLHSDEDMSKKVRDFISDNHKSIFNSPSWKNFIEKKLQS